MGLFNYIRNGTHQSSLILLQPISLDIFLTSQRKFPCLEKKKKKVRFLKLPFQTILVLERMKMNRKLGKQGRRKIPPLFFLFRVLKIKKQWKVENSLLLAKKMFCKFQVLLKIGLRDCEEARQVFLSSHR